MLTNTMRDERKIFGHRLREAREAKGWTQAELAEAVGAPDVTAVSRYEAGKSYPRPKRLSQMASALNISSAYLSGHEQPRGVNPTRLIEALSAARSARDELDRTIKALESLRGFNVVNLHGASMVAEAASQGEAADLERVDEVSGNTLYLVDGERHEDEGTDLGDSPPDGDSGDNGA